MVVANVETKTEGVRDSKLNLPWMYLHSIVAVVSPYSLFHHRVPTGGINELVSQITALCHEQGVPVVFAMSRRRLAYVLKKKHNIGCVGIFSYEGAEVRGV